MRNPERIGKILSAIRKEWIKNPDMRFFQLLSGMKIYKHNEDQFNDEDTIFSCIDKETYFLGGKK